MATEPLTESNQIIISKTTEPPGFLVPNQHAKQNKKKETAEGNPTAHHLPYRIQLTRLLHKLHLNKSCTLYSRTVAVPASSSGDVEN